MKSLGNFRQKSAALLSSLLIIGCSGGPATHDIPKTIFQTGQGWRETIDVRADAALVYGPGNIEERLASWKERGYGAAFMTGIAWGGYQDYFTGRWDGIPHYDQGQMNIQGDTIWHNKNVPYLVPTENFLRYFKEAVIRPVIDAGVNDIFLEEPEFWAAGGYSDSFKEEWQQYYGSPWMPQDQSPEATYLSNKLKYHLYYRALNEVFSYAKTYGKSLGRDIKCYVPTHSLLNYSMWEIVSPEASLASLSCVDGYIAQVWTGTSRVENYYEGRRAERVFETAFLEYGCMASMTRPTGRELWFLTDPIEDRARDWNDFSRNYRATFTAQLLYPQIANYEIMPWPARIFEREYPVAPGSDKEAKIPADFATQIGIMINALQNMPESDNDVFGDKGISVLMGNSLMFQKFPVHDGYEDPQLSNFFGLAMPLLKAGVPVTISHIENLEYPQTLKDVKVLLMTYSNMKPLQKEAHDALAAWVKKGGKLIYAGTDSDPFQNVKEWWNTGDMDYAAPSDHLFSLMGLDRGPAEGLYPVGDGSVLILRRDPKEFAMTPMGKDAVLKAVEKMYGPLNTKNYLACERGPYIIAAVMDECGTLGNLAIEGKFIDLFDPALPVKDGATIAPGENKLLYNLGLRPQGAAILAQAGRSDITANEAGSFSFVNKGPSGMTNRSRISLPGEPKEVSVSCKETVWSWDAPSQTVLLQFPCSPEGVSVSIKY